MGDHGAPLSPDQVAAFVELARAGSFRAAADALLITEQGVRNRLVALENRLGVELYRKFRGPRQTAPLTPRGQEFLPHAISYLERSRELADFFSLRAQPREIHVAASQYLLTYVVIEAVRRFHEREPQTRVRLSTLNEREISETLLRDPSVTFGIAAPYEPAPELDYTHLFSTEWGLVVPPRHRLGGRSKVGLGDLIDEPLILFERGSTGRQHVLDAFTRLGLRPRVHMETTTTQLIVSMVEAKLGIAIVPLLPGGVVTRGRRVKVLKLSSSIRPIDSGMLTRRGESLSPAARDFAHFLMASNKSGN